MKILAVGDPHVKVEDLEDCENLLKHIKFLVITKKIDKVMFSGDLFHNHALIHVSVLNFWNKWLLDLAKHTQVICLKGNHDFGLGNPALHSLKSFKNIHRNITIVDEPLLMEDTLYIPYFGFKREKDFFETISQPSKYLVCHDTFRGAKFENGFWVPEHEAFDLEKVKQLKVISGHIHTPQVIGKCTYLGSPRWQIVSDANTDRFLYLYDENWDLIEKITTIGICKSIWVKKVRSEKDIEPVKIPNSETRYDIYGKESDVKNLIDLALNSR